MIPKECKRLAEVDFPIAVVSRHAVREKSIRHGHPSTLHLWWARRPLAACRAVLLALLLPDPCDPLCPTGFKAHARELLPRVHGVGPGDEGLRTALLKFVGDFANWDLASNALYLEVGRGLVRAAYPEEPPLVVDPFAGGGSIPLEALRLGCEAFASDLNPVACLILKVMLEDIPRYAGQKVKVPRQNGEEVEADGLAEALRIAGAEVKAVAERELAEFYPVDPDGARPIAYLWARTVRCEAPDCGAEIPLMRSFWLSKKANRRRALRAQVKRKKEKGESPEVEFEIFEPRTEQEVAPRTVSRAKATCPCCGVVLPPERVRAQLSAQRGGADVIFDPQGNRIGGARLLTVVTLRASEGGRHYRLPMAWDYQAVWQAQRRLAEVAAHPLPDGLSPVPDEPTPAGGGSGAGRAFSVRKYGMMTFGDMFSARQGLSLAALCSALREYGRAPRSAALALGKLADLANVICPWEPIAECPRNVLSNGRIKPAWDFAEGVPTSESSGSFAVCVDNLIDGILSVNGLGHPASCEVAAAQNSPLPSGSGSVWFTDPPYYDAIPYADLSDLFFVWYKRALPTESLLCDPFDATNQLTPKSAEAVQDETKFVEGRPKDRAFFEDAMAAAFREGRRVLDDGGMGCVVFAHKTTEGWEALISGIVRGGWVITGSWPIATEQAHRLRARDSAALATSVHLVCRPRPEDALVGDWGDVLRELPPRVAAWMERLQAEGVRGADLVFACIGPALEIYSRYARVETAEGREVKLPEYLERVWEVVGRAALEQVLGTAEARAGNGGAGALEEDARLTALFLWTLQSTETGEKENGKRKKEKGKREKEKEEGEEALEGEGGEIGEEDEGEAPRKKAGGYSLIFDVVRRFAQPLGIHLPEWEGRIIETEKGVVRLLPVAERARLLFGEGGASMAAPGLEEQPTGVVQLSLFPDTDLPRIRGRGRRAGRAGADIAVADDALRTRREATTLDRVHAAMLLQKAGRANALRALLQAEQARGSDFLRLANALSALYPRGSEEKRLLDAMLLAAPR